MMTLEMPPGKDFRAGGIHRSRLFPGRFLFFITFLDSDSEVFQENDRDQEQDGHDWNDQGKRNPPPSSTATGIGRSSLSSFLSLGFSFDFPPAFDASFTLPTAGSAPESAANISSGDF